MNRVMRWTVGSGLVLWASRVMGAAGTDIFVDLGAPVVSFVNFLYLAGVAGVVVGGIWAMMKWYNTREAAEGFWGMFTVAISAIWIFFIVPKLTTVIPTFAGGGF